MSEVPDPARERDLTLLGAALLFTRLVAVIRGS